MVENETRIHISNAHKECVKRDKKSKQAKPQTPKATKLPIPMAIPVKVYGPPMSTAVSRVLACLYEKNVEFELISINMSKGEHKKPEFLKLQVLLQLHSHNSLSLFDKLAIYNSE